MDIKAIALKAAINGSIFADPGRLPAGSDANVEGIAEHGLGQSILPDYDHVNLVNREVAVACWMGPRT